MKTFKQEIDDALCAFAKGEEQGLELLKQLITFAPDKETALAVARQIQDEARHARIFSTELADKDIDCEALIKHLQQVYDDAQEYVDKKDWAKCMAIQGVIEEIAMATFLHRYPQFDEKTQEILRGVISDEKRHLEFCVDQMGKYNDEESREKITNVHERVMKIVANAIKDKKLSLKEKREMLIIMKKAYILHKGRLAKLNIKIPSPKISIALSV